MTDREIMQKALEALDLLSRVPKAKRDYADRAIAALRERLAQPEPVIDKSAAIRIATALGWEPPREEQEQEPVVKWDASAPLVITPHPAFQATQQRREWVGLTYGEVLEQKKDDPIQFYRAIEAKLREKNA